MLKKAIYLSGGGARSAYQAGVLKAIHAIVNKKTIPVDILSSVSAGSINASLIAMYAHDFPTAVEKLEHLWSSLSCDKIFQTGNIALLRSVIRNISSMLFHYNFQGGGYLLNTIPLRKLLNENLDFSLINKNIEQGIFSAFEVATTCYDLAKNISFVKSTTPFLAWKKLRHISSPTHLSTHHILASAAFPLFFPSIKIGKLHYGDGGVRLNSPLRASIKLGADRILVIGTRKMPKSITKLNNPPVKDISFAKVLGNMLNAIFLDNLDREVELIHKINESLMLMAEEERKKSAWKPIDVLYINPSVDLATRTDSGQHHLPLLLRYLLSIFGSKEQSSDLLSFLLFDAIYCKELLQIGYNDAIALQDDIEAFFSH